MKKRGNRFILIGRERSIGENLFRLTVHRLTGSVMVIYVVYRLLLTMLRMKSSVPI